MPLRLGVQRRGRLVEDQQGRVLEQRPGDRQTLALAAGKQHAILADLGVEALRQVVDELLGVGSLRRPLDFLARRASQVAVGDVVGHAVVEQRDLLGHQGDVAAQVAQAIILDFNAIKEDLAVIVLVKARNQVGQGRFAATGTADQGDHLPGLGDETDVIQHLLVGSGITEAQVAHFQAPADPLLLDGTLVFLRRFVELLEDALGAGDAALDRGTDLGKLADRLGQQARRGDIGHQVAGRGVPAQPQHEEHQYRHGDVDHQLQHRRVDRAGLGHPQLLVGIALAGVEEALLFIGFAAEAAHHPVALDGFRGDVGDVAHGHLDLLALLAELAAGGSHHHRDDRQDRQHHQGQLPVHPQQVEEQEDHGQALTDHHLDGIRGRSGDHGHVEGDARDQVAGAVRVEIAVRQHQQLVEQGDPQVMHQPQGNLGEEEVAEERAQPLPGSDQDDQQRHRVDQVQVAQPGPLHIRKQCRVRIGEAVDEILEDARQHRLGRREDQETDDAE